jgi:hypothetical protein
LDKRFSLRRALDAWYNMIERQRQARKGLGTAAGSTALTAVSPPWMEDPMCWEMDYYWLAEQRKAQEAKAQEAQNKKQRAELLDKLLNEANREADKSEDATPVKETVPAK